MVRDFQQPIGIPQIIGFKAQRICSTTNLSTPSEKALKTNVVKWCLEFCLAYLILCQVVVSVFLKLSYVFFSVFELSLLLFDSNNKLLPHLFFFLLQRRKMRLPEITDIHSVPFFLQEQSRLAVYLTFRISGTISESGWFLK